MKNVEVVKKRFFDIDRLLSNLNGSDVTLELTDYVITQVEEIMWLTDKLKSAKQEIKNCHADIDQLREIDNERLNVEIPALEAKLEATNKFILELAILARDDDIDGFIFQNMAIRYEIYIKVDKKVPCCDFCACAEIHEPGDVASCCILNPDLQAIREIDGKG